MSRRKRMLEELDQDIRDHIERETQDNIDIGMPPEEARYAAMRKFGNVTRVKEETRKVWSREVSRLCGRCDSDTGTRHWRQHRNFQRGERRLAAATSLSKCKASGHDLVDMGE